MDYQHIKSYMRSLFSCLEQVHQHKIIHRDVKPANFLYNLESQTGVLIDFGLAQLVLLMCNCR